MLDPYDYAIEVCTICGAQLDRIHGTGPSLRCVTDDHSRHGAMVVHVLARPDEQQDPFFRRGVIPDEARVA
jgi:hypothetical protein